MMGSTPRRGYMGTTGAQSEVRFHQSDQSPGTHQEFSLVLPQSLTGGKTENHFSHHPFLGNILYLLEKTCGKH
jgi:hypothetical protein